MSKPVQRLGKGLSALIGPREGAVSSTPAANAAVPDAQRATPSQIPVAAIAPNPRQPRTRFDDAQMRQLADSIAHTGVLQPILVRPAAAGRFELIAGERRWRAAQLAGLTQIPAVVREATDTEILEWALIENLQREDLGPLERAQAYQQYLNTFKTTPEELADRLAESRANVVNYIRLLRLPEAIRTMVEAGELSMGQARAIAGVADDQRQLAIARLAIRRNLSVRQVEELCRAPATTAAEPPTGRQADRHLDDVSQRLSKSLGLQVQLRGGRKKNAGSIVIRYRSLEEFERITERLIGNRAALAETFG